MVDKLIGGRVWAKYRDLSVASRSITCRSQRLINYWSARHWQITIFCDNWVQQLFYHSITEFVFLMNILRKQSDLPFSRKSDRKKEKSTVSFMHVQNIICSQTQLDGIAHEQTIICRQLFVGHVVGCQPMKRKKNLLRMIIIIIPVIWTRIISCWASNFKF